MWNGRLQGNVEHLATQKTRENWTLKKLNGIRKTITSRTWIESTRYRRSSSGNISRIHDVGHPRKDSTIVWTWAVRRQDHLHVKGQRHCMMRKKENSEKCVANSWKVVKCVRRFLDDRLPFLWPGPGKFDKSDGNRERIAEMMIFQMKQNQLSHCLVFFQCLWERDSKKSWTW